MNELIERLEKATGPDRELDAAAESERRRQQAYACGLNDKTRAYWVPDRLGYVESQGTRYPAKPFTASIDAALTLVPEGCFWRVGHDGEGADPSQFRADILHAPGSGLHKATAPTPALAICIAALRAHSTVMEGQNDD